MKLAVQSYECSPRVLKNAPTGRVKVNGKEYNLLIKRDDLSDLTASGNKIRKLEFILPEVAEGSYDWIVSVGGTQSNHCRAVSAVCARVGIPCAHVLRKDFNYREDRPYEGNLFFHKLFGSELFLVPKEEYARKGSAKLLEEAGERLKSEFGAQKPYLLPVGGSTVHGLFGYLECMRELEAQIEESGAEVDEIVFSCGSGGTATGLAVGKYLSTNPKIRNIKLTGYLACDSPEYFHEHVNEMLASIGLDQEVKSEDLLNFVQAKGIGYAINTPEELDVIRQVARTSGIVLDGSYTGKAITGFVNDQTRPEGTRCLFIHTGGIFSVIGNDELLKEQAK